MDSGVTVIKIKVNDMKLDGDGLLKDILFEIAQMDEEIKSSVKLGWYEKAARLHLQKEGMHKVRQMIELGDHII